MRGLQAVKKKKLKINKTSETFVNNVSLQGTFKIPDEKHQPVRCMKSLQAQILLYSGRTVWFHSKRGEKQYLSASPQAARPFELSC